MRGFSVRGIVPISYLNKIQSIQQAALVDVWPLGDTSGSVAAALLSSSDNGTYVNSPTLNSVIFADGVSQTPSFVAASTQRVTLPAATLDGKWNKDLGTLLVWVQMTNASWSNTTSYGFLQFILSTGVDLIQIWKPAVANQIDWRWRNTAGQNISRVLNGVGGDGWIPMAFTWNVAAGRARAYANGIQASTDIAITALNNSALTFAELGRSIGNTTVNGGMGFGALWTAELSAAEVAVVSGVS